MQKWSAWGIRIVRALGALALMDVALSVFSWLPNGFTPSVLLPTAESAAFVLAFILIERFTAGRAKRWAIGLAAGALALFIVISAADALIQTYFDRPFVLWSDIQSISGGLYLVFGHVDTIIVPLTILTPLLILACGFSIAWLIQDNVRAVFRAGSATADGLPAPRMRGWALPGALLLLAVVSAAGQYAAAERSRSTGGEATIGPVVRRSLVPGERKRTFPQRAVAAAAVPTGPVGLGGSDVNVFFLESLGSCVYVRPELSSALLPVVETVQADLARSGYAMASAYLESPVIGGNSWIAEAAFLTGQTIHDQTDYDALMHSDAGNMPRWFSAEGYRTILSMPGTVHGDWPEGHDFYGFDQIMLAPDFQYAGPMFSFVPIPDQFGLEQTARLIEADRASTGAASGTHRAPLFVDYVLVSGHAPFNRIPPYVDDWQSLGDGEIYNRLNIQTFDNDWFRGTQFDAGYIAAQKYVLTVIDHYFTEELTDPGLAILIGDHQPERPVRGNTDSHAVPIYVISRNAALIHRFLDAGFVSGLVPTQPLDSPSTATFFPLLTRIALGESAAGP